MKLTGLHLLQTYQCTFECDHCFVWGSPWQSGTMTLPDMRAILEQAAELGTVKTICFEGGEPFLYYATMLGGIRLAVDMGFATGIVSNVYWATSEEDALASLRPLAGLVRDITISSDLFHYSEKQSRQAANARAAAETLGIPMGVISIARPDGRPGPAALGQLPEGESGVMYRGRAVAKLAQFAALKPWDSFATCPREKLDNPGRVHVDALGNVHACQGLALGNLWQTRLSEICASYEPRRHPIIGPLLAGGPAELARRYGLPHADEYADACHACYEVRRALRGQFPEILTPDQMYGVPGG